MNAPTLANTNIPSLQMAEEELIKVLESSIYPGARLESIKLVLGYCKGNQLDPMTKPVHIVPMSVKKAGTKDQYEWRDVIMAGIELYRTKAARTGEYVGIDEAAFGPDVKDDNEVGIAYPAWCSVTVYRLVGGQPRAFSSGKVFWKETYATVNKDSTQPNKMWRKRAYGQIEKCAEAMALRRAFPEIGAEPTREELEGKVIDHGEITPERIQVEGPKAKSAPPPAPPQPKATAQRTSTTGHEPGSRPTGDHEPPAASEGSHAGAGSAGSTGNGKPAVSKPISQGAANILRKKMAQSSKSNTDLQAKFGFATVEEVTTDKFNQITEWSEQPAAH